jgi:clan AA aspartic protease (TIGR02281 family)
VVKLNRKLLSNFISTVVVATAGLVISFCRGTSAFPDPMMGEAKQAGMSTAGPNGNATINDESVSVFSEPATNSKIVKSFKKGDVVVVDVEMEGTDEKWCGIIENGQTGVAGYVKCKYLTREKIRQESWRAVSSQPSNSQTFKYFTKGMLNVKFVTIEINGIPVEVQLDTGASFVAFDSETVKKLGITEFKQKVSLSSANGMVEGYLFTIPSIRLGTMEAINVVCAYVPSTTTNLLGGSFLSNFNYSVNEDEHTITLTRKGH